MTTYRNLANVSLSAIVFWTSILQLLEMSLKTVEEAGASVIGMGDKICFLFFQPRCVASLFHPFQT